MFYVFFEDSASPTSWPAQADKNHNWQSYIVEQTFL